MKYSICISLTSQERDANCEHMDVQTVLGERCGW